MRQDDSVAGQDRLDTGFHGHCDQGLYDRPTTAIDQEKSRESGSCTEETWLHRSLNAAGEGGEDQFILLYQTLPCPWRRYSFSTRSS